MPIFEYAICEYTNMQYAICNMQYANIQYVNVCVATSNFQRLFPITSMFHPYVLFHDFYASWKTKLIN